MTQALTDNLINVLGECIKKNQQKKPSPVNYQSSPLPRLNNHELVPMASAPSGGNVHEESKRSSEGGSSGER